MKQPSAIAVDGPAGSGKSTLGERLARRIGFLFFDTGVMYRALALAALEQAIDPLQIEQLVELARSLSISIEPPADATDGRMATVRLDGRDVTWLLREPRIDRIVSAVAQIPEVRVVMRAQQRAIGEQGQVVMVGRDIGTIVMPDALLKIYLTASLAERTRRRLEQLSRQGLVLSEAQVAAELAERDQRDQSVMAPAPDALIIDTDHLDPDQVVEQILLYLHVADANDI